LLKQDLLKTLREKGGRKWRSLGKEGAPRSQSYKLPHGVKTRRLQLREKELLKRKKGEKKKTEHKKKKKKKKKKSVDFFPVVCKEGFYRIARESSA